MENQPMAQTKPMMTLPNAVKTCLRKYSDFSGRATRAEYWWWVLAAFIGSSIFTAVDSSIASFSDQGYTPFVTIFSLAIILPGLTVTARRLHDIGKSGWWQLVWVAIDLLALIFTMVGLVIFISSDGSELNSLSGDEASFLPLLMGFAITLLIWLGVFIWSLIWLISKGQANPNRYGPNPRASETTAQEELPNEWN